MEPAVAAIVIALPVSLERAIVPSLLRTAVMPETSRLILPTSSSTLAAAPTEEPLILISPAAKTFDVGAAPETALKASALMR